MTVDKHGNGLPEKPTAHQAGRPYDSFIIINHNKKEQRQTLNTSGHTKKVKRLTPTEQVTN